MTYGYKKDVDHTPHNLFVEMDELEGDQGIDKMILIGCFLILVLYLMLLNVLLGVAP